MPVGSIIGGGANLLSGVVSGLFGGGQKREGKKLLGSLAYPNEAIPQGELDNVALARQRANVGLPSEQYNNAMKNIQRQQMASIASSNNRRGGLMTIADNQQTANDATLNLDAKDAAARMQNQRDLMGANTSLAGWQDKIWDNNVKQKYIQNYNYAMGLIGAGNQNIAGGIDKGISGLGLGLAGGLGVTPTQYYGYGSGYGNPNGNTQAPNRY